MKEFHKDFDMYAFSCSCASLSVCLNKETEFAKNAVILAETRVICDELRS